MLSRTTKLYILRDMVYCAYTQGDFKIPANELALEIEEGVTVSEYYHPSDEDKVDPKEALAFVEWHSSEAIAWKIANRLNDLVTTELEKEL
jgi:hypothetical protein